VAVDINHHKTMYDLHQRVNPQEVIVGWYEGDLNERKTLPTINNDSNAKVFDWACPV
jgi:hypothetical protein